MVSSVVSDVTLLKEMGTDGLKWTEEFCKHVTNADDLDEYQVFTWFANAIEAGRSAGYVQGCRESDAVRDIIRNSDATTATS